MTKARAARMRGDFAAASQLLIKDFSSRGYPELIDVLLAWADERMNSEAWDDARNILVGLRRNLSWGFDLVRVMINEARCLAAVGQREHARALLIVARSQTTDEGLKVLAERELGSLEIA